MPKLVNRVPAYGLHKASGQARVKHRGKSIYLGKYGTPESKDAYARFIAGLPKRDEQPMRAEPVPGVVLSVGECANRYFEYACTYYTKDGKPTSELSVIRALIKPLNKRFHDLPATELGPKKLKLIQQDMIALGWTRRSINKGCEVIKRCFTWCASEELIPASIAMGLKTVRGLQKNRTAAKENAPIGPVDDAHVDAVLEEVSPLVADVIRFMRRTGCRPGEALALTDSQLDRSDPSCWLHLVGAHKTEHHGKSRTILIGRRAQEVIMPRLMQAGGGRVFEMRRGALRRSIYRACERTGVPPWHPNQIRHTYATEVRREHGLEAAQILLGHTYADVTQVYAERDLGSRSQSGIVVCE
jgi:integrase